MTNINTFQGDVFIHEYIKHSGDDNNLFGFSGTDTFKIATAGADRLTVASSGSVSVANDLYISEYLRHTGDSHTYFRFGADTIYMATGGTERMRIIDDGNVGIGTNAPESLLHLSAATASADITDPIKLKIHNTTEAGDWSITQPWGLLEFDTDDANNAGSGPVAGIGCRMESVGGGDTSLCFYTDAASGNDTVLGAANERMCINSDGLVGIGTANPQEALHVAGSMRLGAAEGVDDDNLRSIVTTSPLEIHSNAEDLDGAGVSLNLRSGFSDSESNIQMISSKSNTTFQYISFATATHERMRIKYNGNVGIGTTNPDYKLKVEQGTGNNSNGIFISNSNYGSMQGLNLSMVNNGSGNFSSYAAIQTYRSGVSSAATNLVLNPTAGNVGIGKTTASHLLDVDGNVDALGYGSPGGGTFYMNNNSVRTVYTISSGDSGLLYCYGSWGAYGLAYFQWKSGSTNASCNILVNNAFAAFQTDGNTNIWLKQTTGNAQHGYVKIIKFRPH